MKFATQRQNLIKLTDVEIAKSLYVINKKAKGLYLLKYKVINKLELVPQEYHEFNGRIYALYSYCGYSFHLPTIKTDVFCTKKLQMISSTCEITDLSISEAIENLNAFLLR